MQKPHSIIKLSLFSLCVFGLYLSSANAVEYTGDALPQVSTPQWIKQIPNNNDYDQFKDDPYYISYPNYLDAQGVDDYILLNESANAGILRYEVAINSNDPGSSVECLICHDIGSTLPAMLRENINYWPISYFRNDGSLSNELGTTVIARARAASSVFGIEISDGSRSEALFIRSGHALLIGGRYAETAEQSSTTWVNLKSLLGSDFDTSEFHTYQLSLQDNSVVVYVDCTQVLNTQAFMAGTNKYVRFGTMSHFDFNGSGEVEWDSVTYMQGTPPAETCGNTPPQANAGEDITVTSAQLATTVIQGSGSDADTADTLQCRWRSGTSLLFDWVSVGSAGECPLNLGLQNLAIGAHILTLDISDGTDTVSDDMTLTIDNAQPTAAPTGSGVYEIYSNVILSGNVSDHDGDTLSYLWSDSVNTLCTGSVETISGGTPVTLPSCEIATLSLGNHTLNLEVNDGINDSVVNSVDVQIVDTGTPTITPQISQSLLWPPKHQMVDITVYANAEDNSGLPVTLSAIITSNEPEEGQGDGDTGPDWTAPVIDQDNGTVSLQLRAERSGKGNGRVYTITLFAIDQSGNSSSTAIQVQVAHDRQMK